MEDSLKVTVIATGFRNDISQRKDRVVSSVQHAISSARTASAYQNSTDRAVHARAAVEQQGSQDRPAYARAGVEQPAPVMPRAVNGGPTTHNSVAAHSASTPARVAAPARETPNLASVTEAIRGAIEHDDLDVPAFIRKRGEIN